MVAQQQEGQRFEQQSQRPVQKIVVRKYFKFLFRDDQVYKFFTVWPRQWYVLVLLAVMKYEFNLLILTIFPAGHRWS